MQPIKTKRFYSPKFSEMAAVAVRRLAWALNRDMGQAVNEMVLFLPQLVDKTKVCLACKDSTKCLDCVFSAFTVPQSALSEIVN